MTNDFFASRFVVLYTQYYTGYVTRFVFDWTRQFYSTYERTRVIIFNCQRNLSNTKWTIDLNKV